MPERHWTEETRVAPLESKVAELKRGIDLAIHECRDDDAEDLHNDLVSAEWRLRVARRLS
jgi:hypothetical protein